LLCRYRNICLLILIIFVFFYLFVTLYRNTNNNIHVSFIPFYCTLILTILTILTTCLFFPLSLFLYSFVQLLCRYRNIYLLILIILILTRFFYLFVTLCRNTNNTIYVSFIPFYLYFNTNDNIHVSFTPLLFL